MKKITKSLRKQITSVSLRIKLLGIYFLGLTLLGLIGYGFFIRMEIQNYAKEKEQFVEQARYFEKDLLPSILWTVIITTVCTMCRYDQPKG